MIILNKINIYKIIINFLIVTGYLFQFSGCASPGGDLLQLHTIIKNNAYPTDEKEINNELVYVKNIRGYKYKEKVIFDIFGEKIRNRDEVINRLSINKKTDIFPEKKDWIVLGPSLIYFIPASIITSIIELPAYPSLYYLKRRSEKIICQKYIEGRDLYNKGQYNESRISFEISINFSPSIIQDSDVYYWIAKTYEQEKNDEYSRKYYSLFLKYSARQYPEYFERYYINYTSGDIKLDEFFTEAEAYLNNTNIK